MSQPQHISQDAAPSLSSLRCERWRDGRNRRGWAGETAAAVSHHGEWSGCLHRRVTEHDPQAEVRDCPFPVFSCHMFVSVSLYLLGTLQHPGIWHNCNDGRLLASVRFRKLFTDMSWNVVLLTWYQSTAILMLSAVSFTTAFYLSSQRSWCCQLCPVSLVSICHGRDINVGSWVLYLWFLFVRSEISMGELHPWPVVFMYQVRNTEVGSNVFYLFYIYLFYLSGQRYRCWKQKSRNYWRNCVWLSHAPIRCEMRNILTPSSPCWKPKVSHCGCFFVLKIWTGPVVLDH